MTPGSIPTPDNAIHDMEVTWRDSDVVRFWTAWGSFLEYTLLQRCRDVPCTVQSFPRVGCAVLRPIIRACRSRGQETRRSTRHRALVARSWCLRVLSVPRVRSSATVTYWRRLLICKNAN